MCCKITKKKKKSNKSFIFISTLNYMKIKIKLYPHCKWIEKRGRVLYRPTTSPSNKRICFSLASYTQAIWGPWIMNQFTIILANIFFICVHTLYRTNHQYGPYTYVVALTQISSPRNSIECMLLTLNIYARYTYYI